MYHPSIWHPLDMAAAFRSIRSSSNISPSISPEKPSPSSSSSSSSSTSSHAAAAAAAATHGAFSVNTLLNQTSPESFRFSSPHPSLSAAAAAVHQHQLFSALFQHYPYATAFRPLLNPVAISAAAAAAAAAASTGGASPSLKTSPSLSSASSSTSSTSDSSAFVPPGKRFKPNSHDENLCEISSGEESFAKYSENRCRSSNIDLQNPQCPICQVPLHGQELTTHIQHELETIERRPMHKYRPGQKILQDNHNFDQTFKTRYETYLRVRNSRQQRLNAKLQLHHRRNIRHDTRHCPICYQTIPINTDEEYFFTHVQQCSRKREQLAAVTAIANHQQLNRLPVLAAAAAVVPPPPPPPSSVPPPPPPTTTTTTVATTEMETTVINDDPDINVVDTDDQIERDEKSISGTTSCQESLNSDQRYSPSTQTEMSFSKSPTVPELDPPKCVVCMDWCVKPCVSLTCWHIHCEDCWKKSLSSKAECPQCHLTTTSDHLRRVYLNKVATK